MAVPHPILNFVLVSIRHEDLFGKIVTEAELVSILRTFKRSELLILLSKIGHILHNGPAPFHDNSIQLLLIQAFFDLDTQVRIQAHVRRIHSQHPDEPLIVFSEFQIINLIKLAALFCEENGSSISPDEERTRFGRSCLMMNDLIMRPVPVLDDTNRDKVEERLTQEMISNLAFQTDARFENVFLRAHELFAVIPPQLNNHPEYFDVAHAFLKATGLTILEYLAMGLGLRSWWLQVNQERLDNTDQVLISPAIFLRSMPAWNERWEAMFNQLALPIDEFRLALEEERKTLADDPGFRYSNLTLERYPLIRLGERILCLSPKFLHRKLTQNVFFIINNSLPSLKESQQFRTFYGRLFDCYVRQSMARCLPDRCLTDRYGTDAEAGDTIIVYPKALVVIEAKSSRLSLETIRRGDLKLYREEIHRMVVGGCKQIEGVIRAFREGRYKISGVNTYDIGRFYPVIVTAQSLPQEPLLRKELETLLEREGVLSDQSCAPVTIIDVSELDHLETQLEKMSLIEILGMKTGNPKYRDLSMKNFIYTAFNGFSPNKAAQDKFRDLGQSYKTMLFGSPAPAPTGS